MYKLITVKTTAGWKKFQIAVKQSIELLQTVVSNYMARNLGVIPENH